MQIIDFSSCPPSPKTVLYGGMSGYKDGIIYNGEYWMIKYPQTTKGMRRVDISYTSSPLSEYVGSHIYDILGYDVHQTELGIRNKKLIVACKDFTQNTEPLAEIRTVKNHANPYLQERMEQTFSSTGSAHVVDIQEILLHMKYNDVLSNVKGIYERFFDQMVIDALINNNDRNNGNWGIIYNKETGNYDLAPIFDNGACFNNKISDKKIKEMLKDKHRVSMDALNTVTAYGYKGKKIYTRKMFSSKLPKPFRESIQRNIPLIQDKLPEISEMLEEIPEIYEEFFICSRERKEYMMLQMKARLEHILVPAYEHIMGNPYYKEINESEDYFSLE